MKLHLAFALLALSASAFATVKIKEELFVMGQKPEVVQDLIMAGSAEIDHVSSEGFELYGPEGLSNFLDQKNIPYFDMLAMKDASMADFPTHGEMTTKLKSLAAKYSKIMKLFSIGRSVKGKELWVMKISDNVNQEEVEPEFKYISSMHGDEITGREMTMNLIEELGQKYGSDEELTSLVDNTEIYIMPSMNPDGSEMRRRGNANYVDLNRNFPDMTQDSESSPAGREIENQAVMAWQASRQFSLSANFHGGTIVANYPWDAKYDPHPLDDLVRELSLGYADLNPEMRNSDEFPHGITNGAAWYIVVGGMQDWSYNWFNDLQITLEISHRKWPSYSDIPGFYKSNRDSMVHFMKEVHRGAGFKFSRANVAGTVGIKATHGSRNLGSYAFHGSEFYKVLPEGDYVFTVKEKNGGTQTLNVSVEKGKIFPNGNYAVLD